MMKNGFYWWKQKEGEHHPQIVLIERQLVHMTGVPTMHNVVSAQNIGVFSTNMVKPSDETLFSSTHREYLPTQFYWLKLPDGKITVAEVDEFGDFLILNDMDSYSLDEVSSMGLLSASPVIFEDIRVLSGDMPAREGVSLCLSFSPETGLIKRELSLEHNSQAVALTS